MDDGLAEKKWDIHKGPAPRSSIKFTTRLRSGGLVLCRRTQTLELPEVSASVHDAVACCKVIYDEKKQFYTYVLLSC